MVQNESNNLYGNQVNYQFNTNYSQPEDSLAVFETFLSPAKPELPEEVYSIASLLQKAESEKRSFSVLVTFSNTFYGTIYINAGEIVDAEAITPSESLFGLPALFRMLSEPDHTYTITLSSEDSSNRPRRISSPVNSLLLDSMHQKQLTEQKQKQKEHMVIQEDIFSDLLKVSGVIAASIYNASGEVILSKMSETTGTIYSQIDYIGPLAVEMHRKIKDISKQMDIGTPGLIMVETDNYIFIHRCIIPGVGAIGALISHNGNIGLSKLLIAKICNDVAPYFRYLTEQTTVYELQR